MSKSQLSRLSDQVPEIKRLQERVVELEGLLATAYERAAKVAEQYADNLPNRTTEQTAMRGAVRYAADAIRALSAVRTPAPVEPKEE